MARSEIRTNAILILIALGLVGLWVLIPRASDDEFAATAWSDLVDDPPPRLTVSRGGERVSFAYRSGEAGQLERYVPTFPPETHANPATLDQLILALSRLQTVRRANAAARELGLERPTLMIEIEARNGTRKIELGSAAPTPPNARYAAITTRNQRQLIVLAPDSAQALDVPVDTLLDHRALDVVPSELRRLQWTGIDGQVELTKNAMGQWAFAGSSERARRSRVEQLSMGVSELQYTKHVASKLAAATHGKLPRTVVELTASRDDRAEQFRLSVGGECPGAPNDTVLLVDGPRRSAGCVNTSTFDALLPKLTELRDTAAFSLRVDEIEQLEVRGNKIPFALFREGSEFRLNQRDGAPVALAIGNGILASLVSIHGTSRG
ncbi:MAG TPA: DUF4340 domain-containing protein, partial [Polyangiaceae bacterium]|nr:DUF4340 domain-containing protein [Polyangiaceae bacterium]